MQLRDAKEFKCPGCGAECIIGFSLESHKITVIHDQPLCRDYEKRDMDDYIRWANDRLQGKP